MDVKKLLLVCLIIAGIYGSFDRVQGTHEVRNGIHVYVETWKNWGLKFEKVYVLEGGEYKAL